MVKKTFKIILGVFVAFFVIVGIILIVDISNDVEYKTFDKQVKPDSVYQRVTTKAKSEKDLRTIVEEVKKENKNVDAVWLWIFEPGKNGKLLASARIPYNTKGQLMVGAKSLDYIFKMD
jgi:lipopolysaccharide export LptBFGC system permease protein LptF